MSPDKPIHEIEKSPTEVILFALLEYHGHRFADIRIFFEDDEGAWKPTRKGIAVPLKHLADFAEGVRKLREAAAGDDR